MDEQAAYEARTDEIVTRVFLGLVVAAVLGIAFLFSVALHSACFPPGEPVYSFTPRGKYCSAVARWKPWISFTLGPPLLMALIGWPLRRHRWLVVAVAVALVLVAFADASVAMRLRPFPDV